MSSLEDVETYLKATVALSALTFVGAVCVTVLCFALARRRRGDLAVDFGSSVLWLRITTVLVLLYAVLTLTASAILLGRWQYISHHENNYDYYGYDDDSNFYRKIGDLNRVAYYINIVASFVYNLARITAFVLVFHVGLDTIAVARQGKADSMTRRLNPLRVSILALGAAIAALDVASFGLNINDGVMFYRLADEAGRVGSDVYESNLEKRVLDDWHVDVALHIIIFALAVVLLAWSAVTISLSRGARKLPSILVLVSALFYALQAAYNISFIFVGYNFRTGEVHADLPLYFDLTSVILAEWPLVVVTALVCISWRKNKGGLHS